MSCYLRHLEDELRLVGIEVTKENRKRLDQAVHKVVGVEHKNCSQAWKEVKRMRAEDKGAFLAKLKEELAE